MSTDDTEPIGQHRKRAMETFGIIPEMPRFQSQFYGEWLAETEEEQKLRTLAEQYHQRCEAYDRQVCSGTSPRTGEAMPLTPYEFGLINRHAREVRADILREGTEQGFTEAQVIQAIRAYVR